MSDDGQHAIKLTRSRIHEHRISASRSIRPIAIRLVSTCRRSDKPLARSRAVVSPPDVRQLPAHAAIILSRTIVNTGDFFGIALVH